MRTSINDLVGRRGGADSVEDTKRILNQTRSLLADTSALLELEIDTLFQMQVDDKERNHHFQEVTRLIKQTQKLMIAVLEMEANTKDHSVRDGSAMNLEEARDEVLRRIARIAGQE